MMKKEIEQFDDFLEKVEGIIDSKIRKSREIGETGTWINGTLLKEELKNLAGDDLK